MMLSCRPDAMGTPFRRVPKPQPIDPEQKEFHRKQIRQWVRANPSAWDGWPTRIALTPKELMARIRRLEKHGCPHTKSGLACVAEVDNTVAAIRKQRRTRYRKSIEELAL